MRVLGGTDDLETDRVVPAEPALHTRDEREQSQPDVPRPRVAREEHRPVDDECAAEFGPLRGRRRRIAIGGPRQ